MDLNIESNLEGWLDMVKKWFSEDGGISPKVILLSEEKGAIIDTFDFSNREAAKRVIKCQIKANNAHMVILIYQAWVSNDLYTFPRIYADRRHAISVYGESENEKMFIMQEYEKNSSGKVVFGKSYKLKNITYGALTGFFKP
jgi:hypothetical protein